MPSTVYLLDTNVISELRKARPHGAVLAWRRSLSSHQLLIPAVVVGEIQKGIEITRVQDAAKAGEIESWLLRILDYYTILSMDQVIFREWGRLMNRKAEELAIDAMIAATASVLDLTVATRNTNDFEPFGVRVFNPFTFQTEEAS